MRKLGWVSLGLGALVLGLFTPAWAAGKPEQSLEIILDASGSMAGRIGKESKLAVAKKVLRQLVKDLEGRGDLALGIRVYGHQSPKEKADCQDSKLELPFAAPDAGRTQKLLAGLQPRGYTPLAYSLLQAKDDFAAQPAGPRTIVLITDGLETCQGDPCQVAKELAAAGLKVTLHVVGFQVAKGELAQLACLAAPSGGLVLGADDAGSLAQALEQVVQKALAYNLLVHVRTSAGKGRDAHVEVHPAGKKQVLAIHLGDDTHFSLPPGAYDLAIRDFSTRQIRWQKGVKVAEDKVTELTVNLDAGRVAVSFQSTQGGPLKGYAEIWRVEDGRLVEHQGSYVIGKPLVFRVTPGVHRVRAKLDHLGYAQTSPDLTVAPDQEVAQEFVFGQGRLEVAVTVGGRPAKAYAEVWYLKDGKPVGMKSKTTGGEPLVFVLVPGEYQLRVRPAGGAEKRVIDRVSLADGATLRQDVNFP
ncbi:MAG: VWA domain-containing protein [Deltaproteobacteria bacterium]|nr:VWA domain-containing protein [Deltaproteobacteria bacterium]